MILVGISIAILSFLKLICKSFYVIVRGAFSYVVESITNANIFLIMLCAIFTPFVLLFLVILPFLACIAISIGGFCYGLNATRVFYKEFQFSISKAFEETFGFIADTIYKFDKYTNKLIFSVNRSYLFYWRNQYD